MKLYPKSYSFNYYSYYYESINYFLVNNFPLLYYFYFGNFPFCFINSFVFSNLSKNYSN